MEEQQGTSRRSVLLAGLGLVLAIAAFGAAFYYYDGLGLITGLFQDSSAAVTSPGLSSLEPSSSALALPSGMTDAFALTLWQEQVDSQAMIERLVDGELTSLLITDVETGSAEATLSVTARMNKGASVSGVIGLRRFGKSWYVSFVSSRDGQRLVGLPTKPAAIEDVDVALLNTILAEQADSQPVFTEYVAGTVHRIDIVKRTAGPRTVTIDVEMNEDHGTGLAQIIAIKDESATTPRWFLARFNKTGDYLKKE